MKTIKLLFLIFLSSFLFTNTVFGQQSETGMPYSIIHIVRSCAYLDWNYQTDLTFPNQRTFNLSSCSIIDYKIYSEGEIPIDIEILYSPPNGSRSSKSKQLLLNVKRGGEYYVFYHSGAFTETQKPAIQKYIDKIGDFRKQEENLDFPINRASLANIPKKGGKGQGTCFLISSSGYFITNFHCVDNCKEITIKGIDGDFTTKYGATIVASDPSNDLVLLKISNKNLKFNNPPFALRSSGVAQAEKVFALGFPSAEAMGQEIKITEGIISAKSGVQGDISKFQISAAVNPGNSGGPLIDENGNVIGVIYAKSTIAESAGYAVKSSYLEAFLKNADEFQYPILLNTLKGKTLPEKIAELKNYIFIIEAQ